MASGKANEYFDIGDIIYIPWVDYTGANPVRYQFPFVVVDIADCYDDHDTKHENALWLQALYLEPQQIVFDAPEDTTVDLSTEPNALEGWYYWGVTGTTYTALNLSTGDAIPTTYDSVHKCGINNQGVLRSGYARWKDSAIRQWLNSDAGKNVNWWTSQHLGDVAPTTTDTNKPGWLYGFSNDWLEVFKPVKVVTARNTVTDGGGTDITYDKFFLPSLEQLYGVPQVADVEGPYWPYWKEATGLAEPSNGSDSARNDARMIPSIESAPRGNGAEWIMRSIMPSGAQYIDIGIGQGYLYLGYPASSRYRCAPATVIY